METNKKELINKIQSDRPHVVILGAGASRATCPTGDKHGKKLPLMNDLVDCLNINSQLKKWNVDPTQNFEELFNGLIEKGEYKKTQQLEQIICEYCKSLRLPDSPTIYDHLVLSLRDKDFIASFNWDPLLLQAYRRNSNQGMELPRLAFLHGNVGSGYCKEHKRVNYLGEKCNMCDKPLSPTQLLYPIKKKDYAHDDIIKMEWERLSRHVKNAFEITIFGYSGPKTDVEAISIMKKIWTTCKTKNLNDTTIITNQNENTAYKHWKPFFYSDHFQIYNNFYESNIAKYPRRTFEVYWENNMEAQFTEEFPIPYNLSFPNIWKWYQKFIVAEKNYRKKHPFN